LVRLAFFYWVFNRERMPASDDIFERLWTEVINLDPHGRWLEEFVQRRGSAKHPIAGAKSTMDRLLASSVSREDLGRMGRWLRYETCFTTLYALGDPGLKKGCLAGLDEKLAKSAPDGAGVDSGEFEFFQSLWESIAPNQDPLNWAEAATRVASNDPFGDAAPAIRQLLNRGVALQDIRDLAAWHSYEATLHTLRLLSESFDEAEETSGLHESLLGADPAGMDGRPGSWPLPTKSERSEATTASPLPIPEPTEPYLVLKSVEDFMFSPDNRMIATWGKGAPIQLRDINTGAQWAVLARTKNFDGFAFSPDGKRIAVSLRGTLRVFDIASGGEILSIPLMAPSCVGWFQHGLLVIASRKDRRGTTIEKQFHLLDSETLIEKTRLNSLRNVEDLGALGISPEAARTGFLWKNSSEEFIRFWRWQEWSLSSVSRIDNPGNEWAWSPDGSQIIAGTDRKRIHDAATGAPLWELADSVFGPTAFAPDGKWVLTGAHSEGHVVVWSMAERRKVTEFNLKSGGCFGLKFSITGKVLGARSHRRCLFWTFPSLVPVAGG
jgi:hypothetical protein